MPENGREEADPELVGERKPVSRKLEYRGIFRWKLSNQRRFQAMRISARNQLKGKIKKITPGAVNAEVILELADGTEVVSIITKESVESLGLQVGKDAYAVIKASNVMIATD